MTNTPNTITINEDLLLNFFTNQSQDLKQLLHNMDKAIGNNDTEQINKALWDLQNIQGDLETIILGIPDGELTEDLQTYSNIQYTKEPLITEGKDFQHITPPMED